MELANSQKRRQRRRLFLSLVEAADGNGPFINQIPIRNSQHFLIEFRHFCFSVGLGQSTETSLVSFIDRFINQHSLNRHLSSVNQPHSNEFIH